MARTSLIAGLLTGAAALPLAAEQAPATSAPAAPAAQPKMPAPWMQGAPATAESSHLAPNVAPPLPTPSDKLLLADLKLPKNFHLEVFANGMANARSLRVGDKSTVYVSTRVLDRIYAIVDKIGGMVVVARLNRDGAVRSVEPFMTGFVQNNKYVARPVDIEWLKDGAMLVSDDWNGAVDRITYGAAHQTANR
jgi:glucose/arabinose dehydrogenase